MVSVLYDTEIIKHISMKNSTTLLLLLLMLAAASLHSQSATGSNTEPASPVVSGNSASFYLDAPAADNVILKGSWEAGGGTAEMQEDSSGTWTATVHALPSDLYFYNYYVDDLRITDPLNPFVIRDVKSLFSLFIVPDGPGDFYSVNDVPHGTVSKRWVPSRFYQEEKRLTVYTPPGYENSDRLYPVLYLLHGSGGDEQAWEELGRAVQIMDNLIAQRKAVPMIVVMRNGNPSKVAAPGYTPENYDYIPASSRAFPGYKDGTYETSFDEIVDFVDSEYRTIRKKAGRAIAGLSMGGFHTMMISANHPGLFDYVGLFSPGLNYRHINMELEAYSNLDQKLLKQKSGGLELYWIAIGKEDFLYEPTMEYMERLDRLEFPYTYVESSRGHIWSNWRLYMLDFVPLLFK